MAGPERGGNPDAQKERWKRLALVGGIIFLIALIAGL